MRRSGGACRSGSGACCPSNPSCDRTHPLIGLHAGDGGAERASCPESPFKAEFPIAPKRSAEARIIAYSVEVHASRGKFINAWEGTFDPQSQNPNQPRTMLLWDGRDAAGKPVPSGYYFFAVVFTFPETGAKENRTTCVFYLNEADRDKLE